MKKNISKLIIESMCLESIFLLIFYCTGNNKPKYSGIRTSTSNFLDSTMEQDTHLFHQRLSEV